MSTVAARTVPLAGCRSASVVYGTGSAAVQALHNVDLEVSPGERLALWGRSGSGKTTLLHLLGGLVQPSSGSVHWRSESLSALDAAARARSRAHRIAYVFQGANLLPHLTASENVAFAAVVSGSARSSPDELLELLELVGLGGKLDSLPAELSGGEAQRVAIARALAQEAELLLCDEPTGELDSDTGARVLDLIDALGDEFSFALVLATHDADVAARYGRIVELSDGEVVGEPTP